MKNNNPQHEEINKSIKDKVYGLPSKGWMRNESYSDKRERFDEIETILIERISELGDEMLMHTFIRWQEIRNELNEMYVQEIEKIVSEPTLNTNFNTEGIADINQNKLLELDETPKETAIRFLKMFETKETNINGFGYSALQRTFAKLMCLEMIRESKQDLKISEGLHPHAQGLIAGKIKIYYDILSEIENA